MNTVSKGDALEIPIFDLIKAEIDAGTFLFRSECCRIFRRKGYYSKARESEIVFDVSIEVYLPGAKQYSLLVLIECKNYNQAVPVNDVEEFFTKTQQVAAANSKAIMVAPSGFQPGGLKFAESMGMGMARYFQPSGLKWELWRSASASYAGKSANEGVDFEDALTREDYASSYFDLYCQAGQCSTVSLLEFFEALAKTSHLSPKALRRIRNPKAGSGIVVPFMEKSALELLADAVRTAVGQDGSVDLERLCRDHPLTQGFTIVKSPLVPSENGEPPALGRVLFDTKRIELFTTTESNLGRDRFTLAHELCHVLLKHGDLMRRESSDETDYELHLQRHGADANVPRMEWQANYMAACLLMPRRPLVTDFVYELQRLDIRDKGVGLLYVDGQPCNVANFLDVTGLLMKFYGVSRAAVALRLEGLGLLRDVRRSTMKTFGEALLSNLPIDSTASAEGIEFQ